MANQPDDRKDRGPEDLGDKEGYDESQRAEILEAEGRRPVKDAVQRTSEREAVRLSLVVIESSVTAVGLRGRARARSWRDQTAG